MLTFEFNSKKVRVRSKAMSDDKYRHEKISFKRKTNKIGWIQQADDELFLALI